MMRPAAGSRMWVAAVLAATACKARVNAEPAPSERSAPSVGPVDPGHLLMTSALAAGDVPSIVRDAATEAAAQKRRLVVYVGAEWCEPCSRFRQAAESGRLDALFGDLTLLVFDQDRDGERLKAAGYLSQYIPLFALPAADGTASRRQIEGGIKGERTVAYIAQRLRLLLER
jgi:hypothetical protein